MKQFFLFIAFFGAFNSTGQQTAKEIEEHRAEHLNSLTDTAAHVLNAEEIASLMNVLSLQ